MWDIMYMQSTEEKLKLELDKNILYNHFWEDPVTIPVELRHYEEPYIDVGEPLVLDYYKWRENLMINSTVSPSANFWIISEKLKTILKHFNLCSHKFYEIDVTNFDMGSKYYVLHLMDFNKFIDYSKSTYKVVDSSTKEVIENYPLDINSQEDYLKVVRSEPFKTKKLKFTTNYYDQKYDLLPDSSSTVYPLVSEELKEVLEKEGITGMTFFEYNKKGKDVPILYPESAE